MKKLLQYLTIVFALVLVLLPTTTAVADFKTPSDTLEGDTITIRSDPDISEEDLPDSEPLAKVGDQTYTDIEEAWDAVCANGGTIEMLADWSTVENLTLPEDQSVTLNMNGYMIDFQSTYKHLTNTQSDWAHDNGFTIRDDASLTINGSGDIVHSCYVMNYDDAGANSELPLSTNWDIDGTHSVMTVTGGFITGCWTNNCGVFNMYGENASLVINDAAIAGNVNRAVNSDAGGAIMLYDKDQTVELKNCNVFDNYSDCGAAICVCDSGKGATVTLDNTYLYNNYAFGNGGAIYIDGDSASVALDSTTIDDNSCGMDGGAIYVDADDVTITLNNTAIDDNSCRDDGGAIYVDADDVTVTLDNTTMDNNSCGIDGGAIFSNDNELNITLKNNSSISNNTAEGDGGAICYANKVDIDATLSMEDGCKISGNSAGDDGGAVYVGGEGLTIEGGEISNNTVPTDDGLGGGVYFYNDRCNITGTTFTKNRAYKGGGIYLDEMYCTVKDCDIHGNTAGLYGGGIYVEEDENILSNVSIYENHAGSLGGGVSVILDITLSGVIDIHGNTAGTDNAANNLFLDLQIGSYAEIYGTPADGSVIGISAYDDGEHDSIQLTDDDGDHNISAYTSDSADWHIEAGEDGQLYLAKGAGGLAGSVFGESSLGILIAGIVIILGGAAACILIAKKKKQTTK